ncbi:unnamed protein product [Lasius platythorax]|uniref:Uncharacterized protein n=1 Tax=Lasius platythorax TaxID=488582 RepID=A0AAV2N5Q9_9HYME
MICESRPRSALCWHGNPARYRVQSLGANVSTGGAHKSWFTTDVKRPRTGKRARKKKKTTRSGQRKERTGKSSLRCDAKRNGGSAGNERRNNRPITWVTEDHRSCESRRQKSYLTRIANATGAAKTDSQSQEAPPTMDVELILRPLRPLPLIVAASTAARSDRPDATTRCCSRTPSPPPFCVYASLC